MSLGLKKVLKIINNVLKLKPFNLNSIKKYMEPIIKTNNSWLSSSIFNDLDLLTQCIDDVIPKLINRPTIKLYGKIVHQNRNVAFFSNESIGYKYSNKLMDSQPLTASLIRLLENINTMFNTNVNGILVNQYTNGLDYIGSHSDDETGLGNNGVISISTGANRNKQTKKIEIDVIMTNGMILHMGNFQNEVTHEIPIQKKITESRLSFTFRHHIL